MKNILLTFGIFFLASPLFAVDKVTIVNNQGGVNQVGIDGDFIIVSTISVSYLVLNKTTYTALGSDSSGSTTTYLGGVTVSEILTGSTVTASGQLLVGRSTAPATTKFDVYRDVNSSAEGYITNPNLGTGAWSELSIRNSMVDNSGLRLIAVGQSASGLGGGAYQTDSGLISTDNDITRGLNLATRFSATNSCIRFFTGGITDTQRRMIIENNGNILLKDNGTDGEGSSKLDVVNSSVTVRGTNAGLKVGDNVTSLNHSSLTVINGIIIVSTLQTVSRGTLDAVPNSAIIYSSGFSGIAELYAKDSAGNATIQTEHKTGIFPDNLASPMVERVMYSYNDYLGAAEAINLSALARVVQELGRREGLLTENDYIIKISTYPKKAWNQLTDESKGEIEAQIGRRNTATKALADWQALTPQERALVPMPEPFEEQPIVPVYRPKPKFIKDRTE